MARRWLDMSGRLASKCSNGCTHVHIYPYTTMIASLLLAIKGRCTYIQRYIKIFNQKKSHDLAFRSHEYASLLAWACRLYGLLVCTCTCKSTSSLFASRRHGVAQKSIRWCCRDGLRPSLTYVVLARSGSCTPLLELVHADLICLCGRRRKHNEPHCRSSWVIVEGCRRLSIAKMSQ